MRLLLIFSCLFLSSACVAQNLQSEINNQVWRIQLDAMHSNQADKFMSVMSDEVIQVSYSRQAIRTKEQFSDQAIATYQRIVERKLSRNMEFRFLNRIANEAGAFEDGFYKYELTSEEGGNQVYYGYFQVVLRKEEGTWKVLVDYDSEMYNGVPVTKDLFDSAKPMDSYDH